jgi:hypothetical protein
MDRQNSNVVGPERHAEQVRRVSVANRDAGAGGATRAAAPLDFARKAMLGLAALLTLAWLAALIWGATRLVMAMFF